MGLTPVSDTGVNIVSWPLIQSQDNHNSALLRFGIKE